MAKIECTKCNGFYKLDNSQGHTHARCPYCGAANSNQQQHVPFAQVVEPGTSSNLPVILFVLGGACVFLMLLLVVGVVAFYALTLDQQVVGRQPESIPDIAVERGDVTEQPFVLPHDQAAAPAKNFATKDKSQSSFRYGFAKDAQYKYEFSVKSSLNKEAVTVKGSVNYTSGEVGGTIKSELKKGLPDQIAELPNLMQVGWSTGFYSSTGLQPARHVTKMSDLLCDDTGQVHGSSLRYGEKNEGNFLPIIFSSPERIGLVDFPNDGSTSWSEEGLIQLVSVSATETEVQESAVERMIRRSQSRYPNPYGPSGYNPGLGVYPGLRRPAMPGYRGGIDPYGRAIKEKKAVDVEVKTISINTLTEYKLQTENASTLVLQRVIKGTPADDSDLKVKLNRTEIITFDKKQNVISKIESTGETQFVIDNISLKLPIEYKVELKGVKTAVDLAKDKRERDERNAASKVKRDAERKVSSLKNAAEREAKKRKEEAKDLAIKENTSKYEHADLGDVSWGLKSMAFTPNGRFLICGHLDSKVSVYDTQRKRRVEFQDDLKLLGQVVCITVSPDGKYVLTGGYSGRIIVWKIDDAGLLDKVGQFVGHTSEIKSIAIDPASGRVLSGESDKVARLWSLKTQKEIQAIREFNSAVYGTGFTDGGKIAVASGREDVIFVDAATGKIARKRKGYRSGTAHDIAFSPDGTEFVVSDGYEIDVYETDTASKVKTIKGDSINWKLAYFPDGKHVISGEKAICIWSIESESKVFELNVGKHVNVQAIAASPDGRFVAGNSRPLKLFNNPLFGTSAFSLKKSDAPLASWGTAGEPSKPEAGPDESSGGSLPVIHCQFPEQGWGVDALCFSPDGRYLYAGKYGLQVYDVVRKRTIDNHARFKAGSVTAIEASADGKHVLTALGSGVILVWQTDERGQLKQVGKFVGHSSSVKAIAIGPNSRWVVSGEKKHARVWDLKSQKEALAVDFKRDVSSCRFLPNGKAAVISDGVGATVLVIPEMTVWKKFDKVGNGSGSHSAVSHDGRKIAIASGRKIGLFDSTTGSSLLELKSGETIWTLAFHPDGKHLLAGGSGKVMIWDTEKQTKVAELDVPTSYVQCLAISKDGKRIAAIPGSAGQTLTIFNSPVE